MTTLSEHQCIFCKKQSIKLTTEKTSQRCGCGVNYYYAPVDGTIPDGLTLKDLRKSKKHRE